MDVLSFLHRNTPRSLSSAQNWCHIPMRLQFRFNQLNLPILVMSQLYIQRKQAHGGLGLLLRFLLSWSSRTWGQDSIRYAILRGLVFFDAYCTYVKT